MHKVRKLGLVSLGSLVLACGAEAGSGPDAQSDDSIIRATAESGKDQVVMVMSTQLIGGSLQTGICSGTYTASRVVTTAAHCLQNIWGDQLFVYFGDDFFSDFYEFTFSGAAYIPPAPGQPSHWAQADSYEVHPDYDANLNHPDLGVIYLDRKLPFNPLPIARFRLDNSYIGDKMTVMGWGAPVATGPATADEYGVELTGRQQFMGTPTAADYHADDPNAGLLDAHVRRDLFKLDGRAPNSNMCFGDSGGAMLVSKHGKTYLGGVFFWTGFFCEDYSMFTRMDPFLAFTDKAEKKGGSEKLVPEFECVAPNAGGTYTAYFGYTNKNGVSIDVPLGRKNSLALDVNDLRPAHFRPGTVDFKFGVEFTKRQSVTWSLDPEGSPRATVVVNKHSKACAPEQALQIECSTSCNAQVDSGCVNLPSFDACVSGCTETHAIFSYYYPDCGGALSTWNQCIAAQSSDPANWFCYAGGGIMPDAQNCYDELSELYTCIGY